ncbi:uncharacterized protein LOC118600087 [Oryzias melastigma]|uniref:uncharacterized protein LOC118600087 n=1 Tax=Oryzias melastigma TaxID=30732 RepID=UPI00168D3B60|nr:uncharacterized protein LOC118600087 [Oryzias melastigma]
MALLGSVLVLVLVGSSVSRTSGLMINAGSGENVTLRCEDKNINGMFHLKWIRPNLQRDEIVFLYWNDEVPPFQHESFQNRVFLKNRQMKDGDLSVVLKNVTINDSGIYDCKVKQVKYPQKGWKLISTVTLWMSSPPPPPSSPPSSSPPPPGDDDGVKEGDSRGRLGLFTVSVLLLAVLLLLLLLVHLQIFKEEKTSNQSSNKHQNPDRDLLISDSKAKIKPSNPEPKD